MTRTIWCPIRIRADARARRGRFSGFEGAAIVLAPLALLVSYSLWKQLARSLLNAATGLRWLRSNFEPGRAPIALETGWCYRPALRQPPCTPLGSEIGEIGDLIEENRHPLQARWPPETD